MNRPAGLLLGGFLLFLGAGAFAQEPQTPEDAFSTRDLIAWSYLQKPQPAPQPLPPRDTPIPQPGQPQDQQSKVPAEPGQQQQPVESFTGKIVKDEGRYVLKVSAGSTYQLEGAEGLERFENLNVRVVGSIDPGTTTIHVVKIDLLS